ncbi:MAG TPA: hypothetical protein VES59_02275 [Bacteroidota bacterium]|nr:hypothetical protein [Bacteroidota bacterium]
MDFRECFSFTALTVRVGKPAPTHEKHFYFAIVPMPKKKVRKAEKTPPQKSVPKEKLFVFPGAIRIEADAWDNFFQEARAIFLDGLLNAGRVNIVRVRVEAIRRIMDKSKTQSEEYNKESKREGGEIMWGKQPWLSDERLRELGVRDKIRGFQVRQLEDILGWLRYLTANTDFRPGKARAITELLANITWYAGASEGRYRDEYDRLMKNHPKMQQLIRHAKKFIGHQLSNDQKEKYEAIAKALAENKMTAKPKPKSQVILHLVNTNKQIFRRDENALKLRKSFDRYVKLHPDFLSTVR